MCVFKALHKNHHEDHTPLRKEEFYSFYEVQNLKWREVRENMGDRDGGVFILVGIQVTDKGKDKVWFRNFKPSIRKVFHSELMLFHSLCFNQHAVYVFFTEIHALVKWQWFNSIICKLNRNCMCADFTHGSPPHKCTTSSIDLVILTNTIFLVIYSALITGA